MPDWRGGVKAGAQRQDRRGGEEGSEAGSERVGD